MPSRWNNAVKTHKQQVREMIPDAAARLVAEQGLRGVTMSQIAAETGIGRATLYKYFSSVEAILLAWHEGQITRHLEQLAQARAQAAQPVERLRAVLTGYAFICQESRRQAGDLVALLHGDRGTARGEQELGALLLDLLTEAANAGEVRTDVPAEELAHYCAQALEAAGRMPAGEAVTRLVDVVLTGLGINPALRSGPVPSHRRDH